MAVDLENHRVEFNIAFIRYLHWRGTLKFTEISLKSVDVISHHSGEGWSARVPSSPVPQREDLPYHFREKDKLVSFHQQLFHQSPTCCADKSIV